MLTTMRQWLTTPTPTRDLYVITAALAVLFAAIAGHIPFGSAVRYAEAAREMVELGDWTVPHLHYAPYFEKPILTYWMTAAARWCFGDGMHATHLPSAFAALLSLVATWLLARRLHSGGFALTAALALLVSPLFLAMATEITTDPILAGWTAICMTAWWLHHRAIHPLAIWAFWLALGLGVLTKGLVAIALPGCAIAGYALMTGGVLNVLRSLWAMHPLRGVLILVAVNLPWSIAVWRRDPRFLEFFYVRFNLMALVSDDVNHSGPLWLYPYVLAAAFAPWLPSLGVALAQTVRQVAAAAWPERRADPWGWQAPVMQSESEALRWYLVAWIVFPLLFLTAASSKLGTYVLPVLPALAIVLADGWWRWRTQPPPWLRGTGVVMAGLFILAAITWPLVLLWPGYSGAVAGAWWPLLATTMVAGVLLLAVAIRCHIRGQVLGGLFITAGALVLAGCLVAPRLHRVIPDLVPSRITALLAANLRPGDVVIVDREEVHNYHLVYDLGRRLYILGNAREVGMGHFAQVRPPPMPFPADTYWVRGEHLPDHPFLVSRYRLWRHWRGPTRIFVIGEDNLAVQLREWGMTPVVIARSRNTVLFSNRPLTYGF